MEKVYPTFPGPMPPDSEMDFKSYQFLHPFSAVSQEQYYMVITYINNDGAGFADKIEIAEGTTVEKLFAERIPHGRPQNYLIRINRLPATADQVLQDGDRVSFTPTKIEGAVC